MQSYTQLHQNWMIFHGDMAILQFAIWPPSAIYNFQNLEFMSRDFYDHALLVSCANFTEIRQLAA